MTVLKGTGCTLCAKSELHEGVDKGRRWAYCPLGGTVKKNTHTRKDLGPAARLDVKKEAKKERTEKAYEKGMKEGGEKAKELQDKAVIANKDSRELLMRQDKEE